jgi:PRTRC genetic system protein A
MNGQEIMMKFDELLDLTRQSYGQFAAHTEAALRAQRPMPIAVDEENIEPEKFQLDLAQFAAAPVAAVPRHSEFFPLQDSGHRFLLAADGLYLEVRRPWLHFIHRLAEQGAVAMPYGTIAPRTDLVFGRLGAALELFRQFANDARRAAPNEWAAALAWDAQKQMLDNVHVAILDSTPSSLRYELPPLADGHSLVFDLHSHGHLPAFFSDTDNRDDAGSVKISGVFGDLDKPKPTAVFRLCVLGLYIPIPVPAEKIFGGA